MAPTLGGQQIYRVTKSLVGLCLGCYEVLHETLQVGHGFRRRRRWIVGSSVVETRWLERTLGVRVGVLIKRIWVTLPTLVIGGGVGVILWWWVVIIEGVDVFNARRSIVTRNGGLSLYTTGLTICVGPIDGPTEVTDGVAALSRRCARASTLLARTVTASTSCLPPPLLGVSPSLD